MPLLPLAEEAALEEGVRGGFGYGRSASVCGCLLSSRVTGE